LVDAKPRCVSANRLLKMTWVFVQKLSHLRQYSTHDNIG
jgi:hypothetical protein